MGLEGDIIKHGISSSIQKLLIQKNHHQRFVYTRYERFFNVNVSGFQLVLLYVHIYTLKIIKLDISPQILTLRIE